MEGKEPPVVPGWLSAAFPGRAWRSLCSCSLRVDGETGAGIELEASDLGFCVGDVEETPGQDPRLCAGSVVVAIGGAPLINLEEEELFRVFKEGFRDGAELLVLEGDELRRAAADTASSGPVTVARPGGEEPSETVEVDGMIMQSLPARNRRKKKAADTRAGAIDAAEADVPGEEAAVLEPSNPVEVRQYEYMDHTADVILHSWGKSLQEAIEQVSVCFFSYMTNLDTVDLVSSVEVEATGHDILDMLYHLLDEFLFTFGSEGYFVCRRVEILELDEEGLRVKARGFGERFNLKKHPQGTEIKAITMHQMKILTPETLTTESGTIPRKSSEMEGGTVREGYPFECYVLVDI